GANGCTASNAGRRIYRRRMGGDRIKFWQKLQHGFLGFVDDNARRCSARRLSKIGRDQHNPGKRFRKCGCITSVSEKAQLISRCPPKRCDTVDLDGTVAAQLSGYEVRNGTSGERAGTLTAECVRI